MCTVGDGIISEIKPCNGKLPADRIRDAAPALLEALEEATLDLWLKVEYMNGTEAAHKYPSIVRAKAAIKLARGE